MPVKKALVLSDIHGNLEALDAVLQEAAYYEWSEIWCLGDLCGYGPDSESCFRKLTREKLIFLCGNHDLYVRGDLRGEYFSDNARKALAIGRSGLSEELRFFLSAHSSEKICKGMELVHGSPIDPACAYILNEYDVQANRPRAQKKILLFGHTHIQEYYEITKKQGIIRGLPDEKPLSLKGKRVWINPGSVGQPRDGDNRAAWGIMDWGKKEFTFHRTAYNFVVTQKKLRNGGYPEYLIKRLALGK